jgi:serine/threonine protein kinase
VGGGGVGIVVSIVGVGRVPGWEGVRGGAMAGRLGGGNQQQQQQQHGNLGGQRVIGEYIVTQQIGAGSFAVVWKAHHRQHPGFQVAIKEIATERLNKKLQESLRSEIAILRRTDHPNIIRLHDIVEVGWLGGVC